MKNIDVPKLLRSIAGSVIAKESGQDVILEAAADEIEHTRLTVRRFTDALKNLDCRFYPDLAAAVYELRAKSISDEDALPLSGYYAEGDKVYVADDRYDKPYLFLTVHPVDGCVDTTLMAKGLVAILNDVTA